MKKSYLLLGMLMLTIGLGSCSSDDDDYVDVLSDSNIQKDIVGTWHLVFYGNGWGSKEEYNPGEVTITFTKDGEMKVISHRKENNPFPFQTGTYQYTFVEYEHSIFSEGLTTSLVIGTGSYLDGYYHYSFEEGMLYLSLEAFDGPRFTLRKLK